ncbi:unnamed protein product [Triticum turgidum subsp. durum]|uniref:NB-ARC domain-containing protein n=1 Tax=Triticum turgidum subsp. durum TaxID=4567 RepID=A0A9R0VCP3_TRITD|nr:unnamed protein product [Triticum turgidum subsp. durum]
MVLPPYGMFSPVVGLLVKGIWEPVKKHSGDCLKPGRKVCDLKTSTDGLRVHVDTIAEQIQLGKRPRVQTTRWIESAQSTEEKSRAIINKFEGRSKHMLGCSWNCWLNYRIGRAARKRKKEVDKLKERTPQNDGIFTLLPPVGIELPLPPNIVGQNEYMGKIVGCIEQGSTCMVGICGMGGAGKTTLLKQLNNTFSCTAEMHTFDHVIYVEIGQQQNLGTVQKSIASQLGLTLGQEEDTTSRSASLYRFLKERKFLLLMDNLWQPLDLEKVGIPQKYLQNRQMIVITARDQQICRRMQAHSEVFLLQKLMFEEAWSLFEANAGCNGLTNTNAQIRGYAENIVRKCGGLPLALKIVGQAMASKESEQDWELAVRLLQRSQFHEVPDAYAESDLYHVLYISYDQLPDTRTKQCFLYFALRLPDYVNVRFAIELWMGHGLLDEDNDLRTNDLRGRGVLGCLKRACLLEEHARGQNYASMHDTIKGLALWIVRSKQGDGPRKNWLVRKGDETMKSEEWCTAHRISLYNLNDVVIPGSVPCRWLLTLLLRRSNIIGNVPTGFFRSAPSLTFLDISRTNIRELPLDVGELVNLQHLDLSDTLIQSIPRELQQLKSLRYLYLKNTRLVTIPDGTISGLTMLRVLDLFCSGPFPVDTTHALIKELESLAWLQSLGFTVSDPNSLQRILNPSNKASLKSLYLTKVEGLPHLHIAPAVFSRTRVHELERLTLYGMESLKELSIGDAIVNSDWHFGKLDELKWWDLRELEVIVWEGVVPHACFPKLRLLLICDCHSIKTLSWIKQLPCLEEVYLVDCESMLELVADADKGGTMSSAAVSFPRLKVLGLSRLRNLHNTCDGILAFRCLQRLLVYNCPMVTKLPSGLHKEEHVPVILGRQDWWQRLDWEDSSMESTLNSFFRELPLSFQGDVGDVYRALARY